MALVVSITDQAVLRELALPLIFAGVAAAGYGAIFAARASRSSPDANGERGRAFDLRGAATFALVITAVLFASTVVTNQFGASGLVLSTAAAGFADTHAAAASAASVAAQGTVSDHAAVLPILLGLTTVVIGAAWAGLLAGSQVTW
jgi:uncharacterized membrane protein (DUF4010 family)